MKQAMQHKTAKIFFATALALAMMLAMIFVILPTTTLTAFAEHEHDFTYVASGAKITATCKNAGCTLTESDLTLEILPPTDLAWSETNLYRPTLSGQNDTVFPLAVGMGVPFGPPKVTRSGNPTTIWQGGDNGIKGPGTYTATATIDGQTATLSFTVTKGARSAIVVEMEGWREDHEAKNPSIRANNGDRRDHDKVTYTYKVKGADDSTYTATKPSTPGEYTVKATIPETDTYQSISATTDFTITEAPDRTNYERGLPMVLGNFYYNSNIIDFGPDGQWITDEYGTRKCIQTYLILISAYDGLYMHGQVEDVDTGLKQIDLWKYAETIFNSPEHKIEVIAGDGTQENPWKIRAYIIGTGDGSGSGSSSEGGVPGEGTPGIGIPGQETGSGIISPSAKGGHGGFCIAWIVLILAILELLYLALYCILRFPKTAFIVEKYKLENLSKQMGKIVLLGFVNLLILIGAGTSLVIFLLALIVLCVHGCPVSIVAFLLALLILAGFLFFLFLDWKNKKEDHKTEKKPEENAQEEETSSAENEKAEKPKNE